MSHWVVRGGIANPDSLQKGYRQHIHVLNVYGFSVQYDAQAGIAELALAGQFPNSQISYAEQQQLEKALSDLGYQMQLLRTPGKGYHHTFMVLYAQGNILRSLPDDAANALSLTFQRMANPHPVIP